LSRESSKVVGAGAPIPPPRAKIRDAGTLIATRGLCCRYGRIEALRGVDITRAPAAARVRLGVAQSPEGRQVFAPMSVEDNLQLGGYVRPALEARKTLDEIYALFLLLRERRKQLVGALSGGTAADAGAGPRLDEQTPPDAARRALDGSRPADRRRNPPYRRRAHGERRDDPDGGAERPRRPRGRRPRLCAGDGARGLAGAGRELLDNDEVRRAYLGL